MQNRFNGRNRQRKGAELIKKEEEEDYDEEEEDKWSRKFFSFVHES